MWCQSKADQWIVFVLRFPRVLTILWYLHVTSGTWVVSSTNLRRTWVWQWRNRGMKSTPSLSREASGEVPNSPMKIVVCHFCQISHNFVSSECCGILTSLTLPRKAIFTVPPWFFYPNLGKVFEFWLSPIFSFMFNGVHGVPPALVENKTALPSLASDVWERYSR